MRSCRKSWAIAVGRKWVFYGFGGAQLFATKRDAQERLAEIADKYPRAKVVRVVVDIATI